MNLPTKSQKYLLLIWAFAIGWFYLGSLVNFHQHHIWGKQMIPQVNSSTRNKSKTAPGLGNDETAGFHLPANDFNSTTIDSVGFTFSEPATLISSIVSIHAQPFIPDNEGFAFSKLRGPPQA